ncbi:MAG: hypothetical protein JWP15_1683, partial [Alphaproteobacteria bacterium]|nr:hypothetical protein [Alphaproteobacteria bacterium]
MPDFTTRRIPLSTGISLNVATG